MRKFCVLESGEEIFAWESETNVFHDILGNKVSVVRSYYVKQHDMTKDQYIFEIDLKSRTMKGDYSKQDNLMYADHFMRAIYSMWREAKGLPIDDAYYPMPKIVRDERDVQYYDSHKYKGD